MVVNDYPAHVVELYDVEPAITDQELARLLFGAADATSGFAQTAGRLRRVNHTTALAAFASHLEGLFHSLHLHSPPREEGLTRGNVTTAREAMVRHTTAAGDQFKLRPLAEASPESKAIRGGVPPPHATSSSTRSCSSTRLVAWGGGAVALEVAKSVVPRPPTDARVARRMLVHALGLSPKRQNTTDN